MNSFFDLFFESPVWGMTLTLGAYLFGVWLQRKTGKVALQPILVACILIICVLTLKGASYEDYNMQNGFLNYILSMSAVVLAVPLYRNLDLLKKYWLPILMGVGTGTLATIFAMIGVGKLMGTEKMLILTMLPKSCTTPIAFGVSELLGGVPTMTVAMVVMTGITGAVCGPELLNAMGVRHPIARGIALGSISHAVGTTRAFTEGEISGSMSSLAMALAGTMTAFVAPVLASIFF